MWQFWDNFAISPPSKHNKSQSVVDQRELEILIREGGAEVRGLYFRCSWQEFSQVWRRQFVLRYDRPSESSSLCQRILSLIYGLPSDGRWHLVANSLQIYLEQCGGWWLELTCLGNYNFNVTTHRAVMRVKTESNRYNYCISSNFGPSSSIVGPYHPQMNDK